MSTVLVDDHAKNESQTGGSLRDSIDSKAARRARARAAVRGTVAADHRIVIEDKPVPDPEIFAPAQQASFPARQARTADAFTSLPLVVQDSPLKKRTRIWRSADGLWWRKGGHVTVKPWPSQESTDHAFVLTLYQGANVKDVEYLLRVVQLARQGRGLDLWESISSSWASPLTCMYRSSRQCLDPYTNRDFSPRAYVCTEPLCGEKWHEDGEPHVLDSVTRTVTEGQFSVSVERGRGEGSWHVAAYTDDFYGTPDDVAALINDLQWMRTECERVNAKGAGS